MKTKTLSNKCFFIWSTLSADQIYPEIRGLVWDWFFKYSIYERDFRVKVILKQQGL